MNKDNLEFRSLSFDVDNESRTISGLAIPVESWSQTLRDYKGRKFTEIIERTAVNDQLIRDNDVKVYIDHIAARGTLARSKYGQGSLQLFITERGLEFKTELPNTQIGNEIFEGIKRGDYDQCSFGFRVKTEFTEPNQDEEGRWRRHITEILQLSEISILSQQPAYKATEVKIRSVEEMDDKRIEEIQKLNQEKLDYLETLKEEI